MQPRDLFSEQNISIDNPSENNTGKETAPDQNGRDLFAEQKMTPPNSNKGYLSTLKTGAQDFFQHLVNVNKRLYSSAGKLPFAAVQQLNANPKEKALGAAEEIGNYPAKIANLIPGVNLPLMNFAPKNESANAGRTLGDIGSFFLPGKAAELGLNELSKIVPDIGKGIQTAANFLNKRPFVKSMVNIGKQAGNTAVFNAANNPESGERNQLLNGALVGGGTQTAIEALLSKNPLIKTLGRTALGAYVGNKFDPSTSGALSGGGIGLMFPELAKILNLTSHDVMAKEATEGVDINNPAVKKAIEANKFLGTSVTPAQLSGNRILGAAEKRLASVPISDTEMMKQEQAQKGQQQSAIKRFLNSIYESTPENDKKIKEAYEKADKMILTPYDAKDIKHEDISELRDSAIVSDAFDRVRNKAAFSKIPTNNFKFLSEVKRDLDRQYKAKRISDPNEAHEVKYIRDKYNTFLKDINPDYKIADALSQPKIVRRNIQAKFNKNEGGMTAKNFYNKFFTNEKATQDIYRDTANFPEAQKYLNAMQNGWEHLSNMKTVGQASAQSAQKIDQNRNVVLQALDNIKHFLGAKRDIRQIQYIHDTPRYIADIERISKIPDNTARNKAYAQYISGLAQAYGLSGYSKHPLINHALDIKKQYNNNKPPSNNTNSLLHLTNTRYAGISP